MYEFREYANFTANRYYFTISKYNDDFSIDVDGDVKINYKELVSLPIKFNIVTGNFDCAYNNLIYLEGCPISVGGRFYCHFNKLKTLEGTPEIINSDFDCSCNELTSFKGCPKYIGRNFVCYHNHFKSFEGAPEIIRGKWQIGNKKKNSVEYKKYLLVKKIEKL